MPFSKPLLKWLELLLKERFGLSFILVVEDGRVELTLPGSEGAIVFDQIQKVFSESRSDFPCFQWDADKDGYSSVLGLPLPMPGEKKWQGKLIEETDNGFCIHYDILGLTYWMLTRLEEVGRFDLDDHGRFPASSSHAYLHTYLDRPIVDEWLDILGQVISRLWPSVQLKQHYADVTLSHDVDRPARYAFRDLKSLIWGIGGDIAKRGDLKSALLAPWIRLNSKKRLHSSDPFNKFDWIMDVSERNNIKSAFYFICGRTDPIKDADYEPEHPAIRDLMRKVHVRGHEIGLHPSYNTYLSPEKIKDEVARLYGVCSEENIHQNGFGGRMHYLRWSQPVTLRAWNDAGMLYDSTLGYADRPGFRCGTCFEYPAFDPVEQEILSLRIRPLIAMECTVISPRYMGMKLGEEAVDAFSSLKNVCKKVGGSFTLLWHNSEFMSEGARRVYEEILN